MKNLPPKPNSARNIRDILCRLDWEHASSCGILGTSIEFQVCAMRTELKRTSLVRHELRRQRMSLAFSKYS